jgi:hypothetical protein
MGTKTNFTVFKLVIKKNVNSPCFDIEALICQETKQASSPHMDQLLNCYKNIQNKNPY